MKRPLVRPRHGWDEIKMSLSKLRFVNWIELSQGKGPVALYIKGWEFVEQLSDW